MNRWVTTLLLMLGLGLPLSLPACDDGGGNEQCEVTGGEQPLQPEGCCDPETEPPALEPALCCADGFWAGNRGDGDPSACDGHDGLCEECGAPE